MRLIATGERLHRKAGISTYNKVDRVIDVCKKAQATGRRRMAACQRAAHNTTDRLDCERLARAGMASATAEDTIADVALGMDYPPERIADTGRAALLAIG